MKDSKVDVPRAPSNSVGLIALVSLLPLEEISVCTWLLKDIGWAAAFWPLAFPAATVSTLVEAVAFCRDKEPLWPVRIHRLALMGWLTGNTAWMLSELLLEPRPADEIGLRFPWSAGPIIRNDEETYEMGQICARCILGIVLMFESAVYVLQFAPKLTSLPRLSEDERDQVYHGLFILPWILKDFLWTLEFMIPAIFCAIVTVALLLDYYRRSRETNQVSMLFWVMGNLAWMGAELYDRDRTMSPRRLALMFLGAGLLIACKNLLDELQKIGLDRAGRLTEREGLLSEKSQVDMVSYSLAMPLAM